MNPTLDRAPFPIASVGDELTVSFVESEAGLEALEADWNALFASLPRASPCASHAWAVAWWRGFGDDARGVGRETRLFVVVFRDSLHALVGVLPFVEDRPSSKLKARRLRMLGFVGQNGVFDMTEEPSSLVRHGWDERVMSKVSEALAPGLRSGRWDAVNMRVYAAEGERPFRPLDGLQRAATVRCDVRAGSDYAHLPEAWEAYRKVLTKSMRDNLGYYPRLLTRDGHDWHVRILRAPEEMAAAAVRLAALHGARADSSKGQRHDAHIQGPVQEAFLAGLLRRFAERGEAIVGELVVAGEVVASQAFIETGDTMMVYYSGYRDDWYRYSPVFVIDTVVFREALERGVRRLDFLRNPAPWKTRWLAEPGLPMHRALLVSRRSDSRLRFGLFWAEQAFRRNVGARLPILARQFGRRLGGTRVVLERTLLPVLPMLGRLGPRLAPMARWALVQTPIHHR